MNAQPRLDTELGRRNLTRVSEKTITQVRDLCRHPGYGENILYERLINGCHALDQRETESRWQLFELILTAWRCCQITRDEARENAEQAEIWALNNDSERRAMRARLKALNYRSGQAHLAYEQGGQQVPLTEPDNRQPTLIRRQRKGTQS